MMKKWVMHAYYMDATVLVRVEVFAHDYNDAVTVMWILHPEADVVDEGE